MNCKKCKFAKWDKTKSGRLHPGGGGWCGYEYKLPQLPASMYWVGSTPKPCGGHIDRKKDMSENCPYYQD